MRSSSRSGSHKYEKREQVKIEADKVEESGKGAEVEEAGTTVEMTVEEEAEEKAIGVTAGGGMTKERAKSIDQVKEKQDVSGVGTKLTWQPNVRYIENDQHQDVGNAS